jgi:L-iditol 2-dehydrogenase
LHHYILKEYDMKKIFLSKGSTEIREAKPDAIPDGWVRVAMKAIPICGSDKGAYYSDTPCDWGGHEGSGVVVESRSATHRAGDRVVLWPLTACGNCRECRRGMQILCTQRPEPNVGSFSEQIIKPACNCLPLPPDISFEVGSMACCALGPSFGAARQLDLKPSDTLLVTGLGPVGLGAIAVGAFFGARVIAIEGQEWRAQRGKELGAEVVLKPDAPDLLKKIKDLTGGHGVDKAFDCSGHPQAQRLCLDATGCLGGVAFIGENHKEFAINPSADFIRRRLTLIGSWHFGQRDYDGMLELLRRSPAVPKLISHTFPFQKAEEAFKTFFTSGQAAKVVLVGE